MRKLNKKELKRINGGANPVDYIEYGISGAIYGGKLCGAWCAAGGAVIGVYYAHNK